jgi:hypothetical protein
MPVGSSFVFTAGPSEFFDRPMVHSLLLSDDAKRGTCMRNHPKEWHVDGSDWSIRPTKFHLV